MLTLVIGRAGTGKTRYASEDFARRVKNGEQNLYYIVPEQYSHDAERQLLKICSDTLSLHGEVLSFSRLCSRVFAETGGPATGLLDNGGRVLYMSRALDAAADALTLYGGAERKADFLDKLVDAVREFKSARVSPDDLARAARTSDSPLREKLLDLSLIAASYDALLGGGAADPDDRLEHLARVLTKSTMFCSGRVYFDGFTDFTAQEFAVVEKLIAMQVDMTVCLTCDGLDGSEELFAPSRETALRLLCAAREAGAPSKLIEMTARDGGRTEELSYIERHLFAGTAGRYDGPGGAVELYGAATAARECEYAASRVRALIRSGYRRRDIAVAVCDWAAYGRMAEDIFTKYGVPVFVGRKAEAAQKPPLAVIDAALELITGGWDCDGVFRYLKTGMAGLSLEETDELENYALLWDLKGAIWTRDEDWTLPTTGYEPDDGGDGARLERLNELRRKAVGPVVRLRAGLASSRAYDGKLRALYGFLEEIGLPMRIAEKEAALRDGGEVQLADEYRQLWDIVTRALDQFYTILGGVTGSNAEFARLWKLLIAQYDIASIPVALDRVGLGELSRQRRRDVKCLIVLGASDDVLPRTGDGGGLISDTERAGLLQHGLRLPGGTEERLYRELGAIYSTLTLPSDKLIVSWHMDGGKRASFIVERLSALLGRDVKTDDTADFRENAYRPCFELAASYLTHGGSRAAVAAAAYFSGDTAAAQRLRAIERAAGLGRGRLSSDKASKLYGGELVMSASRVDTFYACRYMYFLQYGLNARPRKPAGFDAPTAGTFMHYVLENVTRELKTGGGFANADDEVCRTLTEKYADRYAGEVLQSFKDKSSRFIYLFNRMKKDAVFIVRDMVGELKNSDFAPLDFELAFADGGDIPLRRVEGPDARLAVRGFVDRLDGWERDGKLYIRVVDYKTGRKKFSLSDVLYGMNMQMLIYLFALRENGGGRYGRTIIPAGVLYAPAREEILSLPRSAGEEELEKAHAKKRRRSGLLLGDADVLEAMERGPDKKYLPVKAGRDGGVLADPAQLEALSGYIDKMLLKIARGVRGGSIEARPYWKGPDDTACAYCDYRGACHFSQRDGDKRRYLKKLAADEAWRRIAEGADE